MQNLRYLAQKMAELESKLAAAPSKSTYRKVMDVPYDCQAVCDTIISTKKGALSAPFSRLLITADTPPGNYVLNIEDCVAEPLVQSRREIDQKEAMYRRHKQHHDTLLAAESALDDAIANAPGPASGVDGDGEMEHELVLEARAALAKAQQGVSLMPRPLSALAGMLRQVPRLQPFYVPFKVVDPASLAEG